MVWGFSYRSHCIWKKNRVGTGYIFRNCHEVLFVRHARQCACACSRRTIRSSVIQADVGAHSAKPEIFLQMIEQVSSQRPEDRTVPARTCAAQLVGMGRGSDHAKSESPDHEIEASPPINGGKRPAAWLIERDRDEGGSA